MYLFLAAKIREGKRRINKKLLDVQVRGADTLLNLLSTFNVWHLPTLRAGSRLPFANSTVSGRRRHSEENMIDAGVIKQMAKAQGAALFGIAPVDRFEAAPPGFHPRDIYPGCKSVVVAASPFPVASLQCTANVPYTFVRNMMVERLDRISFLLAAACPIFLAPLLR